MAIYTALTFLSLLFTVRSESIDETKIEVDEIALNLMLMGQTMPTEQLVPAIGTVVKEIILNSKNTDSVSPDLAVALRNKALQFADSKNEKREKIQVALKEAEDYENELAKTIKDKKELRKKLEEEVIMIFARLLDSL